MPRDVIFLLLGSAIGALADWLFGEWFHRRQVTAQGKSDAEILRQFAMVATLLEERGRAALTRNERGELTGVQFHYTGSGGIRLGGSAGVARTRVHRPTGGIELGGSADVAFVPGPATKQ